MLGNILARNRRKIGFQTPGQRSLLRAARTIGNENMGEIIEAAGVDDLEWFRQMLEYQLEEMPHWISDERELQEPLAWVRLMRTMVDGALHNKRVAARRRAWLLRIAEGVFFVALGVDFTWLLK
jgi:hypothetical protein